MRFEEFLEEVLCEEQPMISKIGADKAHTHVKNFLNPEAMAKHPLVLGKPHEGLEAGTKLTGHSTFIKNDRYHVKASHSETGKQYEIPIHKLNKPQIGRAGKSQEVTEDTHIGHLHNQIKSELASTEKAALPVQFMGQTHHIAGAEKIAQTEIEGTHRPKADMALTDPYGRRKVFISHKKSSNPARIQQYGGIAEFEKAGLGTVKEFKEHLSRHINPEKGIEDTPESQAQHKGKRYTMRLDVNNPEHQHIAKHVMFGPKYHESEHSVNNVHAIVHGQMTLKKHQEGHYSIESEKQINNDSSFNPREHPVQIQARKEMGARVKGNRDFKNTKLTVHPQYEEKGTTLI